MWISLFLLSTIFLNVVCGQEKTLLVFSRDEKSLSDCIRNYLLDRDDYYREKAETKSIADLIAHRFRRTSKTKKEFFETSKLLLSYLRRSRKDLFENNKVREPLANEMIDALYNCSDDESDPPIFDGELRELADVLDFILVDWPIPLQEMIKTIEGIVLLRKYARDALIRLEAALNSLTDRENFRNRIRNLFMQRASLYYDRRDCEFVYILHIYTRDRGLRTYGEINFLSTRREQNFKRRNQPLKLPFVYYFILMHEADRPPYVDTDIFSGYNVYNRMTNADLYIETRIDQFYRVLYFVRELEASASVRSEEDVIYPIPARVLRSGFHEMLYNNRMYRKILVRQRNCLNGYLARFSLRSQVEMGQILSSTRLFQEYIYFLTPNFRNTISNYCQNTDNNSPLPRFYFESEEIRVLLDYILVDWEAPLYFMVRDYDSRELLRRYAIEARAALVCVLNNPLNRLIFRDLIRGSWILRARYYFDGRQNDTLQYIPHRYILGRGLVTTVGLELFYHRNSENFDERNPPITDRSSIYSFLESHPTTNQDQDENDIFSRYEVEGMSSAEYYFETHFDQFKRIILFFNELDSRGILSTDVLVNEPLPYGYISATRHLDLRQILYVNQAYGFYLLSLQTRIRSTTINDELMQTLNDESLLNGRIYEENFIFLPSLWKIVSDSSSTMTLPLNTTMVISLTSTTSKYDERSKRVMKNDYEGQCPNKRSRAIQFGEEQYLQFENNYNNYGYVTYEIKVIKNDLAEKPFCNRPQFDSSVKFLGKERELQLKNDDNYFRYMTVDTNHTNSINQKIMSNDFKEKCFYERSRPTIIAEKQQL